MKNVNLLMMMLLLFSQVLMGQQVDRNSVTYRGGLSIRERIQNFYLHLQMRHNGTDFNLRSKKNQTRKVRKGERKLYLHTERTKKK